MSAYPSHLEHVIRLRDGRALCIRPLAIADEPALIDLFDHLTPEDVRARFLVAMREVPPALLARLSHVDYDHDMALAALHPDSHGTLCGVVRLSTDSSNHRHAEFAVVVRSDWKGHGLGLVLTQEIIRWARDRGIEDLYGTILAENAPMIALARKLGFAIRHNAEDARLVTARLRLSSATTPAP
jgi:acetyltransferase